MVSNVETVFGQVLQRIRLSRALTQEQLGFESGLHRTYISLLERGRKSPSLNTLFQLGKALRVSPSVILLEVEAALDNQRKSSPR